MRTIFALILCFVFITSSYSQDIYERQVKANVTIQAIEQINDEIHFSLYLNTAQASQYDLMLDNADFVVNFNQNVFSNPVLSKASEFANTFVSTDLTDPNETTTKLNVQKVYTDAINTKIVNDKLVINLSGRAPSDNQVMMTNVARIGVEEATHCLGRFKVSGLNGSIEDAKLAWDLSPRGLSTQLFTVNELDSESFPVEIVDASVVTDFEIEPPVQVEITGMTIAPNPTVSSTQVFVESEIVKSSSLIVIDVNGKLVQQEQLDLIEGVNVINVDVNDLPAGSYFIKIGEETGKLIKL